MEELNKNQIVLLTLLVSFVTSIATGIVTISLLDQAPGVTQTINQVVEKTVERVVPSKGQAAAIVTKEVLVSNDDLIVAAVEKNSKALVRIRENNTPEEFGDLGLGIVVSKDGLIVSDRIEGAENKQMTGIFSDGTTFPILLMQTSGKKISLFRTGGDTSKYSFTSTKLADAGEGKLGQSVISLGSSNKRSVVGVGVISAIGLSELSTADSAKGEEKIPVTIETNISPSDPASGYFLVNLSGDIVGIHLIGDGSVSRSFYTPSALIKSELPK